MAPYKLIETFKAAQLSFKDISKRGIQLYIKVSLLQVNWIDIQSLSNVLRCVLFIWKLCKLSLLCYKSQFN